MNEIQSNFIIYLKCFSCKLETDVTTSGFIEDNVECPFCGGFLTTPTGESQIRIAHLPNLYLVGSEDVDAFALVIATNETNAKITFVDNRKEKDNYEIEDVHSLKVEEIPRETYSYMTFVVAERNGDGTIDLTMADLLADLRVGESLEIFSTSEDLARKFIKMASDQSKFDVTKLPDYDQFMKDLNKEISENSGVMPIMFEKDETIRGPRSQFIYEADNGQYDDFEDEDNEEIDWGKKKK